MKIKYFTAMRALLLLICLLSSAVVTAAQFEATVDNTKVSLNQAIKLKLVLTEAKAKDTPELSGLQSYFTVHNVQESEKILFINGTSMREKYWQIMLHPKMPGELIIPVIAIKTDKGMQYTQAINIYVDSAAAVENDLPVKIESSIEKNEVFIQEPFVYKIKISHEGTIVNPNLDKIEISDCVLEEITEPKRKQTNNNGKHLQTIECQYLVTPLKDGSIEIPPVVLRGEIQATVPGHRRFFDPFNSMQGYEPFVVQSSAIKVTVNAAVPNIKPWLPLDNLAAEETWQGLEKPVVGEPIIRTITLDAIGATGQQLPSLKTFHEITGLKVYADAPVLNREIDGKTNKLKGSRKEQLSLIPMQAGTITIPAITITWWDLNQKQKAVTVLPAKQIEVAAAGVATMDMPKAAATTFAPVQPNDRQIYLLYSIIALLLAVLVGIALFVWYYTRKMQCLLINRDNVSGLDVKLKNKATEIKFISDISTLQEFIRGYAVKTWQLPENFSLKEMPQQLRVAGYNFNENLATQLCAALDKALYGGDHNVVYSLEELKTLWQTFSKDVVLVKNNQNQKGGQVFEGLNPT